MSSIFKKIKSLATNGMDQFEEGHNNYKLNIPEIEELAKQRAEICKGCHNFVDEPIDFLKVQDTRIPEISAKMCNDCGCSLPYLLRQNIKICKYWK